MPYSQLDVINLALTELGENPVSAVTDSQAAITLQQKLVFLVPELLRATDWNFAIKYVSNNTPQPVSFSPDFLFSYELPPDYDRMDRFSWQSTGQAFGFYYRILDGLILTNAKPINYYYVVNNADYSVMTDIFADALALFAAFRSSMTVTQNEQLTMYLKNEYMMKRSEAILQNDQERYIQSTPYNDFDRATYI